MLLLILACVSLGLAESAPVPVLSPLETLLVTFAGALAPVFGAWLWLRVRWLPRIDRLGDARSARRAEAWFMRSRSIGVALFVAANVLLGWAAVVRTQAGDLVLIDDLLALAPLLLALTLSWVGQYRLERRLLEASLIADVDAGRPVHAIPSRTGYTLSMLRAQVGFVLAPVLLIIAASEAVERLPAAAGPDGDAPWLWPAQMACVVAVFVLAPAMIVRMWNTVELGDGPVRDDIDRMLRAWRVRVRRVLVWRTGGRGANGAIVGFVRPVRYLLLSDGLIEGLPRAQLMAVCAHEVAHVYKRHMVWLASAVIGSILLGGGLSVLVLQVAGPTADWLERWGTLVVAAGALGLAFFVFGYVSRAFEREADAFAARALSERPGDGGLDCEPRETVSGEAAAAMSDALQRVARMNRFPEGRFTWRHGSIAGRRRALEREVGRPVRRTHAQGKALAARALAGLVLVSGIALAAAGPALGVAVAGG